MCQIEHTEYSPFKNTMIFSIFQGIYKIVSPLMIKYIIKPILVIVSLILLLAFQEQYEQSFLWFVPGKWLSAVNSITTQISLWVKSNIRNFSFSWTKLSVLNVITWFIHLTTIYCEPILGRALFQALHANEDVPFSIIQF